MSVVHHFNNLLVSHCLAQFTANSLYLLEVDRADLFVVVQVEDLCEALLCSCISQLTVDHFQEIVKTDLFSLALQILDHLED
jgi:hypothetical protein